MTIFWGKRNNEWKLDEKQTISIHMNTTNSEINQRDIKKFDANKNIDKFKDLEKKEDFRKTN